MDIKSEKDVVALNGEVLIRPAELSTKIIFWSEGTAADFNTVDSRSGRICFSSETFSLGNLYGRFVSAPRIKCAASK